MTRDNCVFIGSKSFMSYVTAVVLQFTTKNATEVSVKARGKFISRAVDVSEVTVKRFLSGQRSKLSIDRPSVYMVQSPTLRAKTIVNGANKWLEQ